MSICDCVITARALFAYYAHDLVNRLVTLWAERRGLDVLPILWNLSYNRVIVGNLVRKKLRVLLFLQGSCFCPRCLKCPLELVSEDRKELFPLASERRRDEIEDKIVEIL